MSIYYKYFFMIDNLYVIFFSNINNRPRHWSFPSQGSMPWMSRNKAGTDRQGRWVVSSGWVSKGGVDYKPVIMVIHWGIAKEHVLNLEKKSWLITARDGGKNYKLIVLVCG